MSTSENSFKQYSFFRYKEVYLTIDNVFRELGIYYYLIGASARDVYLYKAGVEPKRLTGDVDFAIMLPDMEKYSIVVARLEDNGFQKDPKIPHRFIFESNSTRIDVLPYGKVEEEGTINFEEGALDISVLGYKEVGVDPELFEQELTEGLSIPVASLHGLVILKLVAWHEKPADRLKDLEDVKILLDAAWEIYEDDICQKNSPHLDLFDEDAFQTHIAAARVMGRKMKPVLDQNEELKELITGLFDKEQQEEPGPLTRHREMLANKTVQEIKEVISALRKGIDDLV